jgi:hypothetical protein
MKKENESENFKKFKIPETFFNKLFEFTGSDDSSKGFIIAYVDQDGYPTIYSKISTPIVEMGLVKTLENYLSDFNQNQDSIDMTEKDI